MIKLYTGGRKGAGSALEQGARSDLRLALFPLTGTCGPANLRSEGAANLRSWYLRGETVDETLRLLELLKGAGAWTGSLWQRQFWRFLAGPRWAHGHDDDAAPAAPAVAVSAAPLHNHKKKEKEKKEELPTKAQLERAFSLFRLYLGTSPSEKRGGGDEKKVTAAELRFLLTSLGDKLSDDQVDAMVQQAGRRGVAGDIDVAAFVKNFAQEEWPM